MTYSELSDHRSLLLGSFTNRTMINQAISSLQELSFTTRDLSIISRDNAAEVRTLHATGSNTADGVATGAALGGVAGLLAGAGIWPALGGLLIGGPIAAAVGLTGVVATTVSGAFTGALAGGLIGALTDLGLPEDVARSYDTTIREGGYLLAVPINETNDETARQIFETHGASHVEVLDTATHTVRRPEPAVL